MIFGIAPDPFYLQLHHWSYNIMFNRHVELIADDQTEMSHRDDPSLKIAAHLQNRGSIFVEEVPGPDQSHRPRESSPRLLPHVARTMRA